MSNDFLSTSPHLVRQKDERMQERTEFACITDFHGNNIDPSMSTEAL